jgi:hypothetical protein
MNLAIRLRVEAGCLFNGSRDKLAQSHCAESREMDTEVQSNNEQRTPAKRRWRRWLMLYLVVPLCWFLLLFSNRDVAVLVWSLLVIIYLGLLLVLTFTTMFAEDRFAGRLKFWREALSVSGELVLGGILLFFFLYLLIYISIAYGPGFFQ